MKKGFMSKKIIMIAVLVIAVIIIVSMFPYKRVLAPESEVTVKSASTVYPIVADFNNSTNYILTNNTEISTIIHDKGYNNSFLNFTIGGYFKWQPPPEGGYPGNPNSGMLQICLNTIISGHLAPNLDPKNITFNTNIVSPNGLWYITGGIFPGFLKDQHLYINTSTPGFATPTGSNVDIFRNYSIGLENESKWSIFHGYPGGFYNFVFGNEYGFSLASFGGKHYVRLSVSLPGIRETPYANVTVETVYKGS
jgi:hypothetical protein